MDAALPLTVKFVAMPSSLVLPSGHSR
jgi:hypothetical protein